MKNNSLAIFAALAVAGAAVMGWIIYDRLPYSEARPPANSALGKDQAAAKQPAAISVELTPETAVPDRQPKAEEKPPAQVGAMAPKPDQQTKPPAPDKTSTSDLQKPRFDTVRIEVLGDTVVAGRATPGAEVTLKRNGQPIGKTIANEEGDWVLIPDNPLPKGSSDLSLEQKPSGSGPTVASDQSVAVVVPKQPGEKTMIALVEPGKPTKVLQKAEAAAPGPAAVQPSEGPTRIGDAEPQAEMQKKPAGALPEAPNKPAAQPKTASAEPPNRQALADTKPPEQQLAADEDQNGSNIADQKPKPQATTEPPVQETKAPPETKLAGQQPVSAEQPKQDKAAGEAKPPQAAPPKPEIKTAAIEPEPQPPPKISEPKLPDSAPVSLDAVDYDAQGDIVFSGSAQAGASVRLYVDNAMVGDAVADAQGRWVFVGKKQIRPGTHSLRVDAIDLSGRVKSRIELPFMREEPARVAEIEPAPAPIPAVKTEQAVLEPAPASQPAKDEAAGTEPKLAASPAPEPEPQPKTTLRPETLPKTALRPETPPRTAVISKPQPRTENNPKPSSAEAAPTPAPSPPEQAKVEEAPVSAEPKIIASTIPSGPVLPRNGRVVIQPGNNLWRLSRVVYGKGVLFAVIYEANKSQIRNPDLIYPGQIFAMPNATPPESIDPKRREPLTPDEGASAVQ